MNYFVYFLFAISRFLLNFENVILQMSETDNDISTNSKDQEDSKSNIDESWLKKLDFSEGQSVTDSWVGIKLLKLFIELDFGINFYFYLY